MSAEKPIKNIIKGVKGFAKRPFLERFWENVVKGSEGECWKWTGWRDDFGYGNMWVDGRHRRASQLSWEIANNAPFPADKVACHTCDNPNCVNPAHIWAGTMKENIQDCVAKGRKPNAVKTHCIRGHEFNEVNTRRQGTLRRCRLCEAIRHQKYRAKARQ